MVLGATELSPFLFLINYIFFFFFYFWCAEGFAGLPQNTENVRKINKKIFKCDNPALHPCLEKVIYRVKATE